MEKRLSKSKKALTAFGVIFFLSLGLIICFSPYGNNNNYPYPLVEESIIIETPVGDAFDYLGNSDNAENWSVFVDHIETINKGKVPDGAKGSVRRCFVQKDKKGMQWDEEIVSVIPNKRRELRIYNFVDFPMTADQLATEQVYKPLSKNRCKVTFTLFFKDKIPSYFETLKMHIGSYQIKSIFKENMKNIKKLVEKKYKKRTKILSDATTIQYHKSIFPGCTETS